MSLETQHFYEFGDFRLDLAEKVLLRDGKFIPVTPKVFETLCVLVESAGRTVEKDELMQRIWQERFVEESNLTFNIGMLRKALGDDASKPRYVETVPRRGYRFIAEVRRVGKNEQAQEIGSLTEFPVSARSVSSSSTHPFTPSQKAAVVALADWRHETGKSEDAASALAPEATNGNQSKIESIPATPIAGSKRNNRFYVLAGLICAVVIAGIGYGFYRFADINKKPSAFSMSNIGRLTSSGNAKAAAVSPDGKFVAYVLDENGRHRFWLKNVRADSSVQIPLPAETLYIGNLTFSPDGNFIYYGAKNSLYQFSVLGGAPKKILSGYNASQHNQVAFAPDGKQFAFIRNAATDNGEETAAIIIADADGGGERILATSRRPNIFLRSAAWSPDGDTIACAALNTNGLQEVVAVSVADGAVSSIPSPLWGAVRQVVWQPSGDELLLIGDDESSFLSQIWSLPFPVGKAENITADLNDYQSLSLTADGRTIVAVRAEQEAHLWVAPVEDSTRARQLTGGFEKFDGVFGINWTADGKIIYETAPSGKIEIWRVESDGRDALRLAGEGGAMGAAPDGKYLIYQHEDGEGTGLFRLNWSDGERKRLTKSTDLDPAFSPDGKWFVFTRYAENVALWRISIDGGEAKKLTDFPGFPLFPAVSPDGKFIAFFRDASSGAKQSPLAVIAADGGEIVKDFEAALGNTQGHGEIALQWTADGQAIDYVVNREGVSNIWRQPLDGSPPIQLTNFDAKLIFNFAAAPNGKQFAFSRGTYSRDAISIGVAE